jgi:hypothetical protein
MGDFSKYTHPSFDNNYQMFSGVVFGSDSQLLEVELNELQEISKHRLRKFIQMFGNCRMGKGSIGVSGSNLVIEGEYFLIGGETIYIDYLEYTIPPTTTYLYLCVSEPTVTGSDTLPEYGVVGSDEAENTIIDTRYNVETSRRKALRIQISTSYLAGSIAVALLGYCVNSSFQLMLPVFNFETLTAGIDNSIGLQPGGSNQLLDMSSPAIPTVSITGVDYGNILGVMGRGEFTSDFTPFKANLAISSSEADVRAGFSALTVTATTDNSEHYVDCKNSYRLEANKYYFVSCSTRNINSTYSKLKAILWTLGGAVISVLGGSGASYNNTANQTQSTRLGLKIATSQVCRIQPRISLSTGADSFTGAGHSISFDSVMIHEITADEYVKSEAMLLANYPYVDSYGALVNPYLELRHGNLVVGGSGEDGLESFRLSDRDNVRASVDSGWIKVQRVNTVGDAYIKQLIPVIKGTVYSLSDFCKVSGVTSGNARITIYQCDDDGQNRTFLKDALVTTSTTEVYLSDLNIRPTKNYLEINVGLWNTNVGATAYFKKIMLNYGVVSQKYIPCKVDRCLVEGTFGTGDTVNLVNGKAEGTIQTKHVTLYGKNFNVEIGGASTGFKQLNIPGLGCSGDRAYLQRFDGAMLARDQVNSPLTNSADEVFNCNGGTLWLTVPNTVSGWIDSIAPVYSEAQAYLNGWKALATNNNKYIMWASQVDGTLPKGVVTTYVSTSTTTATFNTGDTSLFNVGDIIGVYDELSRTLRTVQAITAKTASTITVASAFTCYAGNLVAKLDNPGSSYYNGLNFCVNNVAPNFKGYQFHFKSIVPSPVTESNVVVKGDLITLGESANYLTVDTGVYLDEKIIPSFSEDDYEFKIGCAGNSEIAMKDSYLNHIVGNIMAIKRAGIDVTDEWDIQNIVGMSYQVIEIPEVAIKSESDILYKYSSVSQIAEEHGVDYKSPKWMTPPVGYVSILAKNDLASALNQIHSALGNRQPKSSVLSNVVDLADYELIDLTSAPISVSYTKSSSTLLYTSVYIPFKVRKRTKPTLKMSELKFRKGNSSVEVTGLFKVSSTFVSNDGVTLVFSTSDTAIINDIMSSGLSMQLCIEADCRGRA